MRILLVGDYPADPRLGSAKVIFKLREEFTRLGHHCDALFAEDLGAQPRHRVLRHLTSPLLAHRAIVRAGRRRGPYDVIDVASGEGVWYGLRCRAIPGDRAVLISRSNGLEHLDYRRMIDDHRHGVQVKPWSRRIWYPLVRLRQVSLAARCADRLVLLNPADRDFAVRQGWKAPSRIDVVPHGVSMEAGGSARLADCARGRGILFCGSWTAVKGVSYLAAAFSRLIDEGVRARLTVLGGGVPAATVLGAFSRQARESIDVVGRVSEVEVVRHYYRHDLLVLPSTYEGFGLVLPEAMHHGLPVVATPVGAALTLVRHGHTGLLVPPRDPEALCEAMARLLSAPELGRRLAGRARTRVRSMSWTATARKTLRVYERAWHDEPSRRPYGRRADARVCRPEVGSAASTLAGGLGGSHRT